MNTEAERQDYSISMAKANLMSLWFVLPVAAIYLVVYAWFWGWQQWVGIIALFITRWDLSIVLITGGIVIHEGLHAAAWSLFGNKPWSAFTFGFSLMGMAPYAHCSEPMRAGAYRIGVLAPGLLLGILPYLIGLMGGAGWFTGFGFLFTLVAAGDFLMLWIIRTISSPDLLVQDHPDRVGCIVMEHSKPN